MNRLKKNLITKLYLQYKIYIANNKYGKSRKGRKSRKS